MGLKNYVCRGAGKRMQVKEGRSDWARRERCRPPLVSGFMVKRRRQDGLCFRPRGPWHAESALPTQRTRTECRALSRVPLRPSLALAVTVVACGGHICVRGGDCARQNRIAQGSAGQAGRACARWGVGGQRGKPRCACPDRARRTVRSEAADPCPVLEIHPAAATGTKEARVIWCVLWKGPRKKKG